MSDLIVFDGGNGNRTLSRQRSTSDTLVAATINTTETAFATSYVFPANYFTADVTVRVTVTFETLGTAVIPTSLLKMRVQKAGPTNVNLYTSTALAYSSGTTSYGGVFLLTGTAAAGSAVNLEVGALFANINGPFGRNTLAAMQAVDTNLAQTLQFTQTFSSNAASNSITLRQLLIEELG